MIEAVSIVVLYGIYILYKLTRPIKNDRYSPSGYDDWHRPQYAETIAGNKTSGYKEYMESMDNFGR